ncbi:MAG: RsmE family RNA methyltransferase [Elusimicrobiota bacterium]
MPQFHISSAHISNNHVMIKGDEFNHICRVVRKKTGDQIDLFDENGKKYSAVIACINDDAVICKITETRQRDKGYEITLYQCLPKSSKMDFIVEKATELGVSNIVPVISKYVVARPEKSSMNHKIERWRCIALSASKQSGNAVVPVISEFMSIEDAFSLKDSSVKLVAYEMGDEPLSKNILEKEAGVSLKNTNIKILIGAEGGLSGDEIKTAHKNNWRSFRLHGNILRAETAPIVILSIVKYILGEL